MKNTKNFKVMVVGLLFCMVVLSFFNLIRIFTPSSGVLISSTELHGIKSTIDSYSKDPNSFKIYSLEGNKRYISVTFASADYYSEYKKISLLYDTKKNRQIKSLDFNDTTINLFDCSVVKYVTDNTFLILDSFGNLYSLDTTSDKFKVNLIAETGITEDKFFKSFYKDNSLYLISRDKTSKYNEKIFSNNTLLEVNFKKNKFKHADIVTHTFEESDFIYSFVLDTTGNVGVVGSNSKDVLGETANALLLPSDEEYLKTVPSSNKNYKFIDTACVWVKFFKTNSIVNINEEHLNLEYRAIHNLVNKKLNVNISSPSNIPIIIGDEFVLYSGFKYEDLLYNASFFPVSDLVKIYTKSGEEKESISTSRNNLCWFNYKTNKYIAFLPSKDNTIGIKKDGSIEKIIDSTACFIYKKTALYLEDNAIKFKKI